MTDESCQAVDNIEQRIKGREAKLSRGSSAHTSYYNNHSYLRYPSHAYVFQEFPCHTLSPNPPLQRGLTISKLNPCSCATIWGEVKGFSADNVGAVMDGSSAVGSTSCMPDVSLGGRAVWVILPCYRCSLGLNYPNLSSFDPMSYSQARPVPDLATVTC